MNDKIQNWKNTTWQIQPELDVPELDLEAVQFAVRESNPVEEYKKVLAQSRIRLQNELSEEKDSEQREALLPQTYAALDRHEFAKARGLALQMVRVDPNRADYLQAAAKAFKGLGMLDSAVTLYKQALMSQPHDGPLRNELGQLYLSGGNFRLALEVFNRALLDDPELDVIREGIALVYIRTGTLDSAQIVANSLFARNTDSPGAHLLELVFCLAKADTLQARYHCACFARFGSKRSDYRGILDYYSSLR